jgi:WD40 repeat protein
MDSKPHNARNGHEGKRALFEPIRYPLSWIVTTFFCLAFSAPSSNAQEKPFSLDHLQARLIPAEDRSDLQPKELVAILGSDRGRIWGHSFRPLAFGPGGCTIACVAGPGAVWLRDTATGKETAAIEIEKRAQSIGISHIAFSHTGKKLAIVDDELILLFDLVGKKPKKLAQLKGHEQGILDLVFSPDDKTLVSVGSDKTARLWDLSATPPKEKALLDSGRYSLAISQDGEYLAIGEDGSLILWDITEAEPKELASAKIKAEDWKICGFLPDNKTLITNERLNMSFWRQEGEKLACIETWKLPGGFLGLSADGKWLVTTNGNEDGIIQLLKLEKNKFQFVTKYGPDRGLGWHYPIAISSDGKKLAYLQDECLQVLDNINNKASPLFLHQSHLNAILSLAFSPDGKLIATGGSDNTIRLWNLTEERPKSLSFKVTRRKSFHWHLVLMAKCWYRVVAMKRCGCGI